MKENHRWLIAIAIALFLASSLSAQESSRQSDSESNSSASDDSKGRLLKLLDRKIDVDYDETPLVDIIDEIQEEWGVNIYLDQSAIDDSLTLDDPITINARDVEFRIALRLMLKRNNATFVVKDGILHIISKDVAGDPEYFTRRIINCRDLLLKLKAYQSADAKQVTAVYPLSDAAKRLNNAKPRGGVFDVVPRSEIKNAVGDVDESNADELYLVQRGSSPEASLIDVIKSAIAPDDWDDTNGDGSIGFIGGCLVIQSTEEIISDVERFLDDLANQFR